MGMPPSREDDVAPWSALAAEIDTWDGSSESGTALVERLRALRDPGKSLQGALGTTVCESLRAMRALLAGKTERAATLPRARLRLAALDSSASWPWSEPARELRKLRETAAADVREAFEDGLTLARVAAAVATTGGARAESARKFLDLLFRQREREYWVPTAVAWSETLADASASDAGLAWLDGLAGALTRRDAPLAEDERHLRRHVRTLALLVAIRGRPVAGRGDEQWLESALDDYSDTTAALGGCAELAAHAEGDVAARAFELAMRGFDRVRERFSKALTYQTWEPARILVELRGMEAGEAVLRVLCDANPLGDDRADDHLAGDLFDAGVTLRWLEGDPSYAELAPRRASGAPDRAGHDATRTLSPEVCEALRERLLRGRLRRQEALVRAASFDGSRWSERIGEGIAFLAEARWSATPPAERVARLAEVMWLLEFPGAKGLDWPSVASAIGAGWLDPTPGTIGEVGWVDLVAVAAERDALCAYFLHRRPIDVEVVDEVTGKKVTHLQGLSRLMRARWQRDEKLDRWCDRQDLTKQAGTLLTRRLVAWQDDPDEVARLLLAAVAIDAPPRDSRKLLVPAASSAPELAGAAPGKAGGKARKPREAKPPLLWKHVATWAPGVDVIQRAVKPLVEWDAEVPTALSTAVARCDALLEELASSSRVFSAVAAPIRLAGECALAAVDNAPRRGRDGPDATAASASPDRSATNLAGDRWLVAGLARERWRKLTKDEAPSVLEGTESRLVASPRAMKVWADLHLVPLAARLAEASRAIRAELKFAIFDVEQGAGLEPHVRSVKELVDLDAPLVECPLLDEDGERHWRAALEALRKLAEPLPTPSEMAVDELVHRLEGWIEVARSNDREREERKRDIREAMADGREEELVELLRNHHELLGQGELRKVGNYFLQRLNFGEASRIRTTWKAPVPTALSYFSPLLFGVIGAPLSSIQTDKIWEPLLDEVSRDPWSGHFHFVAWTLLLVSIAMLGADLRRSAASLDRGKALQRAASPIALVLLVNFAINWVVYRVTQGHPDSKAPPVGPMLPTVFLWGSLSLFLGVFIGLIAQGRRPMEEGT